MHPAHLLVSSLSHAALCLRISQGMDVFQTPPWWRLRNLGYFPAKNQLPNIIIRRLAHRDPSVVYCDIIQPSKYRLPPFFTSNPDAVITYVSNHQISPAHVLVLDVNQKRKWDYDLPFLNSQIAISQSRRVYFVVSGSYRHRWVIHLADNNYFLRSIFEKSPASSSLFHSLWNVCNINTINLLSCVGAVCCQSLFPNSYNLGVSQEWIDSF